MTYIYDILLNFNSLYFEFYDWNKDDEIYHIKKIPIYKIKEEDLKNIIYGIVVFDNKFLEMIKDKTEVFFKHEVKKLRYSCLLCCNGKIVAINLNDCGKIIGKSDLLVDEYMEVLNVLDDCFYTEINYILEQPGKIDAFKTRKTYEKSIYIKNILQDFTDEELAYIYYEIFLENEVGRTKIISRLIESNDYEQLYKLVKMIGNKYKKIK